MLTACALLGCISEAYAVIREAAFTLRQWLSPKAPAAKATVKAEQEFFLKCPAAGGMPRLEGLWLGRFPAPEADSMSEDERLEMVSWNAAKDFIARLNERAGEAWYRLPTEAEWEYAARAGTSGDRYGDLDAIAWYSGNSGKKTHPVGETVPNSWGLYDMLGNVWEWVEDRYGDYPGASVMDPRRYGAGKARIGRGGSWDAIARACRASARGNGLPNNRDDILGLRLLRMRE